MSGKSRNEGVRVIAQFRDRAIPLSKSPATPAAGEPAIEGVNEGVHTPDESPKPPSGTGEDSAKS